jgi:hypothetical protein
MLNSRTIVSAIISPNFNGTYIKTGLYPVGMIAVIENLALQILYSFFMAAVLGVFATKITKMRLLTSICLSVRHLAFNSPRTAKGFSLCLILGSFYLPTYPSFGCKNNWHLAWLHATFRTSRPQLAPYLSEGKLFWTQVVENDETRILGPVHIFSNFLLFPRWLKGNIWELEI